MNQMQHLTEIIRKDDTYQFRYEIPTTKEETFALPVFTNQESMIENKLGKSLTIKKLVKAEKKSTKEVIQDVDKETAELIYTIAKNSDMIQSVETFEFAKGFVVRIK